MAPVDVIVGRLRRDLKTGGDLYGLVFIESIRKMNDKPDSLPYIRIVDMSLKEEHGGGAGSINRGVNSILRQRVETTFQLVCDVRNGWYSPEGAGVRDMGCISLANLVMDSMEDGGHGVADCTLDNTVDSPVMFSLKETAALDMGLVCDITATILTRRFARASRSNTFLV